jgi:perosamine synthetase
MKDYKGWKFKGKELSYIREVLSSDFKAKSSGTMNERLEIKFAKIHNQRYAVTANSGTSTLHMALNAFGVGHGDEVIIPGLTVAMCGYAVWQCGAVPVYADIKKDTFLIDPEDIQRKITKKTKAIMVVHLYGLMCDMTEIMKIAKKNKLFVLEDCAQCVFAKDEKKRIAGTIGDVGSWSFENSKHITTGDGGNCNN